MLASLLSVVLGVLPVSQAAVTSETQTWTNARIGGGGFTPGIVFNPSQKGLAYLRTDIGGAYKLNADDTWTPLTDFANDVTWHDWGTDAIATDPVNPQNLYLAVGMYTNSYDPNNGNILKSTDQGKTWTTYNLPFKVGGNMPGRGMGERLAVDPNNNNILYFGARSGHGLWKSTNAGATWSQITAFPDAGTYIQDPTDTTGYGNDKIGIAWVTFDSTSKTSTGSSRIFVGVASLGHSNVYMTTNNGATWTATPAFNTTLMPHKGVLSPAEKALYVTFSNGAGPYDGSAGRIGRFNIATGTWTDITPAQAISDNDYGFGGLAVDLQKPGTIMAAALNLWWPDAQIYRSTNSGQTWSPIWAWQSYPTINRYFGFDATLVPWLAHPLGNQDVSLKLVGWMIETLVIDPFDSNHWLYGTGATVQGGHNLLNWDTVHNVTVKATPIGIEETAVLSLISPPTGTAHLLSAVGDIGGFLHTSLTTVPNSAFATPSYGTTSGLDYAGNLPVQIVRVGSDTGDTNPQIAMSNDGGATWYANYAAPPPSQSANMLGGSIAFSANADTLLWSKGDGVFRSQYQATFSIVSALPTGSVIASDKKNGTVLYAASGNKFYVSTNTGVSWTSTTPGTITAPKAIAVNPFTAGELWLSGNTGIVHSKDYGKTFTALPTVTGGFAIAAGAPKTAGGTPALFAEATVNGVNSLYRTDDQVNWILVSDAGHGFGSAGSVVLAADPRIYKRVYVGTNGRGVFYNSNAM